MRYFLELTENEMEMLEENGTIEFMKAHSAGPIQAVNPTNEPWLLFKSIFIERTHDGY